MKREIKLGDTFFTVAAHRHGDDYTAHRHGDDYTATIGDDEPYRARLEHIEDEEYRVVINGQDENVAKIIEQGCWTPVERFAVDGEGDWSARFVDKGERHLSMTNDGMTVQGLWKLGGAHNLENALAAVAAAKSAGVSIQRSVDALTRFDGVKRRMERTATVADIALYDDFAHHPTAIKRSIAGMKRRFPTNRLIVALEPRSNTMKMGVHADTLATSLEAADLVFVYRPDDMDDAFDADLATLGDRCQVHGAYDDLVEAMAQKVDTGDQVVFMSNGGFGASRQKLTMALQSRRTP